MPITTTGFQRQTLAELVTSLTARLRGKISAKLDLSERTVLGNWLQIAAAALDDLEQLAEETYSAQDPDAASDDRFVAIADLTGVPRRGAVQGLVTATLARSASFLGAAPGALLANVQDEPANTWTNRDAVAAGAATGPVVYQSVAAAATARAPAGTLNVIAAPAAGWLSITNALDAAAGQDIESIPALRVRRAEAIAIGGSRTRNAIRAAIVLIDGVQSVEVFENVTGAADANGILPHGVRPVVYDGSPASALNDEIAQAIWDRIAEGILSQGAQTGTAQDEFAGPTLVAFDRATIVTAAVAVTIESTDGVAIDDVQTAIRAAFPRTVGDEVTIHRLQAAVFSVPGVDDFSVLTLAGGGVDLPAVQSTIYLPGVITVTGDVA